METRERRKLSRNDSGNPLKWMGIHFEIKRAHPSNNQHNKEYRSMLSYITTNLRNVGIKKILQYSGRRKTELFPRTGETLIRFVNTGELGCASKMPSGILLRETGKPISNLKSYIQLNY